MTIILQVDKVHLESFFFARRSVGANSLELEIFDLDKPGRVIGVTCTSTVNPTSGVAFAGVDAKVVATSSLDVVYGNSYSQLEVIFGNGDSISHNIGAYVTVWIRS